MNCKSRLATAVFKHCWVV